MTVAENGRRFNEDSRAWEDTEAKFYDVAVERAQLRENVAASLHKGDRVTVTGDYRVGAYATSTGKPGLNHRLWADDVAASMQFNPEDVSKTIQQNGGFIQGIRPGKPTAEYLKRISNRITLFGAIYLSLVAFIPSILSMIVVSLNITSDTSLLSVFSTTGILIVVSVALELEKQLQSQLMMKNYKGFLK